MSQMIVRPPFFHPDTLGNPAIEWRVYVGRPNLSPRQEVNQLDVFDLDTGNEVSQPYFINVDGYPVNSNGQKITPVIEQQEYSLRFESPTGGSPFEWRRLIGDGLSNTSDGGDISDVVLNNLQQGLGQDLNAANYVFIKAENSGWEGTATGADISSFYYRDGTVDIPSAGTGDSSQWFDAAGVRYTLAISEDSKSLITKSASNVSSVVTTTPISSSKTFKGFSSYSVDIFVGAELEASDGTQSSDTTISVGATGDCTIQAGYSSISTDTNSVTRISNAVYNSVNIPALGSQVIAGPTFLLGSTDDATHIFKFNITTQRETEITITQEIVINSGSPQFRNQGIFINVTPIE